MAAEPTTKTRLPGTVRLTAFDPRYAERVVSWVRGAEEAYWLAPRNKPPLTADKIRAWAGSGRQPMMLVDTDSQEPVAYGELNMLLGKRREFWLGHLIVDPMLRGCGLGRRLTELLLRRAFKRHAARRVSLVVFPDNAAAIASYRAAGMREDGFEIHSFSPYGRRERLLRLVATRLPV